MHFILMAFDFAGIIILLNINKTLFRLKYIHIMSQGLLSFVEGINLSFISKNQTQFLFFSFQYNDSMLVYYGSTKLNFPVFQTYCLLEMETKKICHLLKMPNASQATSYDSKTVLNSAHRHVQTC